MSNANIQAAIDAAKANAGELATSNLPVIDMTPAAGAAPTVYSQPQAATLDGFLDSGTALKVDHWLQVTNMGFKVKDTNLPVDGDIDVLLANPRADLKPFFGIRINIGGKATYFKTVDRVTCLKSGKPWGQVVAEAANAGEQEYKGFDIRMTAANDVLDVKGNVVAAAGKTLGFSTSITNFSDVADFASKLRSDNLLGVEVAATIANDVRKNDKNKEGWGALTFGAYKAA